ncbi:hypothetical protein D3C78_1494500 [compost metagenome]
MKIGCPRVYRLYHSIDLLEKMTAAIAEGLSISFLIGLPIWLLMLVLPEEGHLSYWVINAPTLHSKYLEYYLKRQ